MLVIQGGSKPFPELLRVNLTGGIASPVKAQQTRTKGDTKRELRLLNKRFVGSSLEAIGCFNSGSSKLSKCRQKL